MPHVPAQPAAAPTRRPSVVSYVQEHDERDELTEASNAVVDMIQAGNLDAAEQVATTGSRTSPMSTTATTVSAWSAKPAAITAKPPTTTAKPSMSSATTPTTTIRVRGRLPKAHRSARTEADATARSSRPLQPRFSVAGCSAASRHPRLQRGASLTPPALPAPSRAGRRRGMVRQSHQGTTRGRTPWTRQHTRGHEPPPLKFRDQKPPITHTFPCSGSHPPFRSRIPICFGGVSCAAGRARPERFDEPPRQSLRQRQSGELHEDVEGRGDLLGCL